MERPPLLAMLTDNYDRLSETEKRIVDVLEDYETRLQALERKAEAPQ